MSVREIWSKHLTRACSFSCGEGCPIPSVALDVCTAGIFSSWGYPPVTDRKCAIASTQSSLTSSPPHSTPRCEEVNHSERDRRRCDKITCLSFAHRIRDSFPLLRLFVSVAPFLTVSSLLLSFLPLLLVPVASLRLDCEV